MQSGLSYEVEMQREKRYDVFLSHNSADKAAVEYLAQQLRQAGLKPFLDRWYLLPGRPWLEALEEALTVSRACAVLLGPQGLGRWQRREMWVALDRQARDSTFLVIPVLLPGSQEVPSLFLSCNTWVDMRRGVDDEVAFHCLLAGIWGEAPGPEMADLIAITVRPYIGLRAFREEDARFFYGREESTNKLVEEVERLSFLAVVGASGSGKSSVVRAGLVPALRRREAQGDTTWEVAVFTPGDAPLRRLAAPLVALLEPEMDEITRLGKTAELADYLREGRISLAEVVERVLEKQPGTERLLLVADQFEELFTLSRDEAEQALFLDQLLAATADRRAVTALLTLRGDFYGRCLEHRSLADRLNRRVFNLGPMKPKELRRAIEEPAKAVGLHFEAGLAERILEDVAEEPGGLPLLEFALTGLWDRRRASLLTHKAYEEIGEVGGAIAQRAEVVFDHFTPEEQAMARRVFSRLVRVARPEEGTKDTRQHATLAELDEATRPVVKALTDARLLVTGWDEAAGEEMVGVAHEALIRGWERLRRWLDEDREFLLWRQRLDERLDEWQKGKGMLLRDASLSEAERWLAEREGDLSPDEQGYIQESLALQEWERQTARQRVQRTIVGLVGALVVISVLALLAFVQGQIASQKRKIATSRELAAAALNNLNVDPERSLLLAMEAVRTSYTFEAEDALRQALLASHVRAVLRGHEGMVISAAFSPDGKWVVTASDDKTARVWEAATGRELAVLRGHESYVYSAAFSPDGKWVVTASDDKTARVWEAATGKELAVLRGHEDEVYSAAFSPDGKWVVTASDDKTARVWEAATGRELAVLRGHESYVNSAAFSPDGKWVVTASDDKTARVWEAATGKELAVLRGHESYVYSAAFSPDGKWVVTTSWDGTARVWEAATGRELAVLRSHEDKVYRAALSPDGKWVVTASFDKTARVWEAATGKELAVLRGHESYVNSAAFSPDGKWVVTASDDNTARVWEAATGKELAVLRGHEDKVYSAAFSPDGKWVVTASGDKTARVWEAATGKELAVLRGHESYVYSAAFSPDGKWVVTTSDDKTARVWEAATGRELAVLRSHEDKVYRAAFSPDGKWVVTASDDKTARVWEAATGKELAVLRGHEDEVYSAAFSPDGKWVVTASDDKTARVWEAATGKELAVLRGHESYVNSAAFSPDGKWVVTASGDKTARVWEAATGKELAVLRGHESYVYSAAFSPDGKWVVTASDDKTARVWEATMGRGLAVLRSHEDKVHTAFSPDGKWVVTAEGCPDPFQLCPATARVWEAATGRELAVLRGHEGWINSAAFSPDGKWVVTAGWDGTARVWEAATGRELAVLRGHKSWVYSAAFSPNGEYIVTASADGTARIYLAHIEDVMELARSRVTRELTPEERRQYLHED